MHFVSGKKYFNYFRSFTLFDNWNWQKLDEKLYFLGGMNDQNYVEYEPQILQYDSQKAVLLK